LIESATNETKLEGACFYRFTSPIGMAVYERQIDYFTVKGAEFD
jgi:hypothetical protein